MCLRCTYLYRDFCVAGSTVFCKDPGYTIENGFRTPPVNVDLLYYENSVLRYYCKEGFVMTSLHDTQTCLRNMDNFLAWTPPQPPVCLGIVQVFIDMWEITPCAFMLFGE